MRLPEVIDQHEDPARFVRLGVKNCPAVGGNRDLGIHGRLNCQEFPDLTGGEFVEADVTVSHFVGNSEEVNPLFAHSRTVARGRVVLDGQPSEVIQKRVCRRSVVISLKPTSG